MTASPGDELFIRRSADFSPCRTWRYTLKRVWDRDLPVALFVLLNPSTADARNDDPTNRRGIGYAIKWGCGGVTFVNLFAYRTPHPRILKRAEDPVGPDNDEWILREAAAVAGSGPNGRVILAWGIHGTFHHRDAKVIELLQNAGAPLWCMGLTKGGHPKHILYLPGTLKPVEYRTEVPL